MIDIAFKGYVLRDTSRKTNWLSGACCPIPFIPGFPT